MNILAEKLDRNLHEWKPYIVFQIRQQIIEIIDLTDHDVLDIMQSLFVERKDV